MINSFKVKLITTIMLRVRSFNEKHRNIAKVTTFFALILITLLSLILTLAEKVCSIFGGSGALGKRALGVILSVLLLFVTSRASIFVPPVIDTIVEPVVVEEAEETDKAVEEQPVEDQPMAEEVQVPQNDKAEEASAAEASAISEVQETEVAAIEATEAAVETSTEVSDEATTEATTETSTEITETAATPFAGSDVDLESYMKDYPETVAWVYFEDGHISYPIMQSSDNKKYKTKDYTGEEARTGAIFLDYRSNPDFSDYNSIVYGHNMKDGTMFGSLRDYRKDPEYINDHQYFQIILPGKKYRYRIFAYMDVPENYVIYDYVAEAAYEFVKDAEPVRIKSYMDSEIPVNPATRVVTLSTCTDKDDLQFVILGVLVEEEEN